MQERELPVAPGYSAPTARALSAAIDLARARDTDSITTEHLLLGLLSVENCGAAVALRAAGAKPAPSAQPAEVPTTSAAGRHAHIPLTPPAQGAIAAAMTAAEDAGDSVVQSAQLLLALLASPDATLLASLESQNLYPDAIQHACRRISISREAPAQAQTVVQTRW